jgi:hypothetical protein
MDARSQLLARAESVLVELSYPDHRLRELDQEVSRLAGLKTSNARPFRRSTAAVPTELELSESARQC